MTDRDTVISSSVAASVDNAPAEWKEQYFMLAKILLRQQLYIAGEDIKAFLPHARTVGTRHSQPVGGHADSPDVQGMDRAAGENKTAP